MRRFGWQLTTLEEKWNKKNGSREGLRLPSASPLLGIEASGMFTEEQVRRFFRLCRQPRRQAPYSSEAR
jgi:hypothetical protein